MSGVDAGSGSGVGSGIPEGARPEARELDVPEVRNVRDLGGLVGERGTIRSGLILRTAALHELTAEGADVLAGLGLRTVIDLRLAVERELEPSRVREYTQLADVVELWMPLVPDFEDCPDSADGSYRFMVERGATTIAAVLNRLAEPGALPAIVHCTAGKDRTGIIVAALLSTLGVPIEQIHADYMRSNETLADRLIYPANTLSLNAALALMGESRAGESRADGSAGTVEAFLEQHGVTHQTLAALHTTLLGPDGR